MSREPDLAARLKARLPSLRARLARRDAVVDSVREANATRDPRQVADWLLREAADWIPAPVWVVVARDLGGDLAVLADRGLVPDLHPSLWMAANAAVRHRTEYLVGNLAAEPDAPPSALGAAVALPLLSRGQVIGVLVGLDPAGSVRTPSLGTTVSTLLRTVLEPACHALDSALALELAEALSVTDDLTRLYNSRYLNLVLRRETKRATRNGRPLSLLFLDLDGFKDVNDRYGHLAGSQALTELGVLLKGSVRETDIAARFGGDEFALVLPETDAPGALLVAERVRDRVRAHRFLAGDGLSVQLTASIGIATLPDAAASAEELLRVADAAMYRVKASGKNGIQAAQE